TGEIDAANTIALSISDAKHNSDDTLGTVTIRGVPSGWSLSAGSDQGGGVWTEAVADLGSLSIVAPAGTEDTVVALAVTATATEAGAVGSATTSTSFNVTVSAVDKNPLHDALPFSTGEIDAANTIALSISDAKH